MHCAQAVGGKFHRGAGALIAVVALALGSTLVGCGGGGGGDSDAPTKDEGPQSGADYFPLAVGDRWFYADNTGATSSARVTGTQATSGGVAQVVRTADGNGASDDLYVKTSSGISLLPGAAADPLSAGIGPLLQLRLPVVTGDRWVIADRTLAQIYDIDGDGRAESISVRADANVIGFETVATAGGSYPHSAHVRTTMTQSTVLSASGQSVSVTLTSDDWYAPDIGPVRSVTAISGPAGTVQAERGLTAWSVGGRRSETVAPMIVERSPTDGELVLGAFALVQLRFSEAMDTSMAGADIWQITGPNGQLASGTFTWQSDGRSLVFGVPTGLTSGTYTARVLTTAQDLLGNPLGAESAWTFTVDVSGPAPTPVLPLANAADVPLDTKIIFTLDEDPDPSTVNTSNVLLYDELVFNDVEVDVLLSGRTVTVTPKAPLISGRQYRVTVARIADSHGNRTSNTSWGFTADPGRFAAPQQIMANTDVTAVAIGDVDGDGHADVVMTTGRGIHDAVPTLFVFHGDGQGGFMETQRFTQLSRFGDITSMVVADLDGKGQNSVILGAFGREIQILRRQPDGTLGSSQVIDTNASYVVRVADMNGDGRPDLIGRPTGGSKIKVWLQGEDGRFGLPIDVPAFAGPFGNMAVGDVDGDGQADIVTVGYNVPPVDVVLRTPDGGYANPIHPDVSAFGNPHGVAIGDVTGDGLADVVMAHLFGSIVVTLAQQPQGGFAAPVAVRVGITAESAVIADIDGDGRADVLTWTRSDNRVALNRQRDGGTLGGIEYWPIKQHGIDSPGMLALGDLNSDGRPDIVYGGYWLRQRAVPVTSPPAPESTPALMGRAGRLGLGLQATPAGIR